MREQHLAVEQEVRDKVATLVSRPSAPETPAPQVLLHRLFEEGQDCYRAKDYARAIAVWERAAEIDPDHKTLTVNLQIVRMKLESRGRNGLRSPDLRPTPS